jgi:hypothetical protein
MTEPGNSLARALASTVMVCGLLSGAALKAQVSKPSEYQVKAAYLSNFGRFVEWPSRARAARDEPFYVCVVGQDPFGNSIDAALAGETIDRARLVAKRIERLPEAVDCRIVFISSSEDSQLKAVLAAVEKASILTISDMPEFAKRGGMIQFVLDGNRVRFQVNLEAVRRVGLNLSSDLLKLALAVRRTP